MAFTYSEKYKAVESESRTCFGIAWFLKESDADGYAAEVRAKGHTYNGGMFHGMACGRDRGFDKNDPQGKRLYAVTH